MMRDGLGAAIHRLRNARGLTQAALGRRVGRSQAQISRWEWGEAVPSVAETGALERALRVPGDTLLVLRPGLDSADPTLWDQLRWLAPSAHDRVRDLAVELLLTAATSR